MNWWQMVIKVGGGFMRYSIMILKEELLQMEKHLKNDTEIDSIKRRIDDLKKAIQVLQQQTCL